MRFKEISPELNEVSMTPDDFARAIESAPDQGVLIGFEFEVCVRLAQQKITVQDFDSVELGMFVRGAANDTIVTDENIDTLSKLIQLKQPVPSAPDIKTLQELYKRRREVAIAQVRDVFNELPVEDRRYELKTAKDRYPEKLQNEYEFARLISIRYGDSRLEYVTGHMKNGDNVDLYTLLMLALTDVARVVPEKFDIDYQGMIDTFPEWNSRFKQTASDLNDDNDGRYRLAANMLKPRVKQAMGARQVHVFTERHEEEKNLTDWYIEPDPSLAPNQGDASAEIVSPPLRADQAMTALKDFYRLARSMKLYTSAENRTGLHINMSIPKQLDPIKLALFLGDEHVLRQFGRENNKWAQSVIKSMRGTVGGYEPMIQPTRTQVPNQQIKLGPGREHRFRDQVLQDIVMSLQSEHRASISSNGEYFSFRHAGGNYLADYSKVVDTVGRFARAMMIASDPNAYRQEYLAKLYKLVNVPTASSSQSGINSRTEAMRAIANTYRYVATNGAWAANIIATSSDPSVDIESKLEDHFIISRVNIVDLRPITRDQALQQLRSVAVGTEDGASTLVNDIITDPTDFKQFMSGTTVNYKLNHEPGLADLAKLQDFLVQVKQPPRSYYKDISRSGDYMFLAMTPVQLPPNHPVSQTLLSKLTSLFRQLRLGQPTR